MSITVGITLHFSCYSSKKTHVFININAKQNTIVSLLDHLLNMLCLPINLKLGLIL